MRPNRIITSTLVAIAALAVAPATGATANSNKVKKLSCTLDLFAQGAPNPSGIHFGFANCPHPFGRGLHYNAYTVTPTSPGHGTIVGKFKNYYNRGTASGTFALMFAATSPKDIMYTGTVTYVAGTGRFKRVRGKGTIQCTTSDGGVHKSCTVNSKLRGI